jgi:hypothetical protein
VFSEFKFNLRRKKAVISTASLNFPRVEGGPLTLTFQILRMHNLLYKKRLSFFPSPAGIELTNLSLAGNNLKIPAQGEFGYTRPGRGKR